MSNITEFLLARIADEKQLAEDAASEGRPHRTGWQLWTSKKDTTPGGEELGPRGSIEASPARVLAECEAKRRIVAIAAGRKLGQSGYGTGRSIMESMAAVWADHPDYRMPDDDGLPVWDDDPTHAT